MPIELKPTSYLTCTVSLYMDSVQALALSLVHAGPIMLYNAYQSSNYDVKTHPAEAAIDGNIHTSSQTAVDTSGCKALNDDGLYGVCGVLAECMTSPYYTGAYASTPSNPYWTAGFTSDISVRSEAFSTLSLSLPRQD